jgi:hypothetical protein
MYHTRDKKCTGLYNLGRKLIKRKQFGKHSQRWGNNINRDFKEGGKRCGLYLCSAGQTQVTDSCKHGNETEYSIKSWNFWVAEGLVALIQKAGRHSIRGYDGVATSTDITCPRFRLTFSFVESSHSLSHSFTPKCLFTGRLFRFCYYFLIYLWFYLTRMSVTWIIYR